MRSKPPGLKLTRLCRVDILVMMMMLRGWSRYIHHYNMCILICVAECVPFFFYCVLFLSLFDSLKNATFYLFLVSSVYIPFSYTLLLLLCVSMLFLLMFFKHKNLCLLNTLTHFMNTLPLLYSSQPAHRLDN